MSAYYRKRILETISRATEYPEELRDVVYYKRVKFVDRINSMTLTARRILYGLPTDHYGELGFSLEHHCIEGATAGLDDSCF